MNKQLFLLIVIILSLLSYNCSKKYAFKNFDDFVNQVNAQSMIAVKEEIIQGFLEYVKNEKGFPYMDGNRVYFIYYDTSLTFSDTVRISGPYSDSFVNPPHDTMQRINGTDFFYYMREFESDARLDYAFRINNSAIPIADPLNPPSPYYYSSELIMPAYIPPPEIHYYEKYNHGTFSSIFIINSREMGQLYRYQIYLPPQYNPHKKDGYPTIYFLDGDRTLGIYKIDNIVDYLINNNMIREIIVILLFPNNRYTELALDENFARFMANELVPTIDSTCATMDSPDARAISGFSLGGLASTFIAVFHAETFGLCSAQSPAYEVKNSRILELIKSKASPDMKVYMDFGTYEGEIRYELDIKVRDLLIKNGNKIIANIYHEAHHFGQWRAHIDDGLKFFFPPINK